jgi:hypothetical protein
MVFDDEDDDEDHNLMDPSEATTRHVGGVPKLVLPITIPRRYQDLNVTWLKLKRISSLSSSASRDFKEDK